MKTWGVNIDKLYEALYNANQEYEDNLKFEYDPVPEGKASRRRPAQYYF